MANPRYDLVLDRPIAYHRVFRQITSSLTAAIMLSQAVYWSRRTTIDDGWFYKTQPDWEEETGLSRSEYETARRDLVERGLIVAERRGVGGRMHFQVQVETLNAAIGDAMPQNRQMDAAETGVQETSKPECRKPANRSAGNQQTLIYTETTAETTDKHTANAVTAPETDERAPVDPEPDQAPKPYALFEAVCAVNDWDPNQADRNYLSKQLGIAKRLIQAGFTVEDVTACLRYLMTEPWLSGQRVDLSVVSSQIGRWNLNGRPVAATARPRSQADLNCATRRDPSGKPKLIV